MISTPDLPTDLGPAPGARAQFVPYLRATFDGHTVHGYPDRFFGRCSHDRDVAVEVRQWVHDAVPTRRALATQMSSVITPAATLLAVPMVLSALADAGLPIPTVWRGAVLLVALTLVALRCTVALLFPDRVNGRRAAAEEWLRANTTPVGDPKAARAMLGTLEAYLAEVDPHAPAAELHARILATAGTPAGTWLQEEMSSQTHLARARRIQAWSCHSHGHDRWPLPLIFAADSSTTQDTTPTQARRPHGRPGVVTPAAR